jgi:Glycosyl transferase family 2
VSFHSAECQPPNTTQPLKELKMKFDNNSEITIVITSCERFDLLTDTLRSLDENNTCPVKEVILIEDSGNEGVRDCIPKHWSCQLLINNPKLGQIKSIDLAYSRVSTPYIFHCEDDWMFYRKGFMEDSLKVLNADENILQVWLRDFSKDIGRCYPFHAISKPETVDGITYFKLESFHSTWKGFSFNPGLRRKSDYEKVGSYFCNKPSGDTEGELSKLYFGWGMFAAVLEQSAVRHIGWGRHVND